MKNIPNTWLPVDLHRCFAAYGMVVGTFLYQDSDEFGNKCGLVEMGSHRAAREVCARVGFVRSEKAVLSILPTNVMNLAEWLYSAHGSVEYLPTLPPGLGNLLFGLLSFFFTNFIDVNPSRKDLDNGNNMGMQNLKFTNVCRCSCRSSDSKGCQYFRTAQWRTD